MNFNEQTMAIGALQMMLGVYVMAGILSDAEGLRANLVLRESLARVQREKAAAAAPMPPIDLGGGL